MNVTITLLIYWSIAAGLIGGGLFSLAKGFKLVQEGKGKTKERSSIEFLGIKVTVGTIGALVMITSFMWGWAAKLALPNYKDAGVEICALRQDLSQKEKALTLLKQDNSRRLSQIEYFKKELDATRSDLRESQMMIASIEADREEDKKELEARLAEQQAAFDELRMAVDAGNRSKIEESYIKFEESTMAVKKLIEDIF